MMRSSQNSNETDLSPENIAKLQADLDEKRRQDRKILLQSFIDKEQDPCTKMKLKTRQFFMWLYNID